MLPSLPMERTLNSLRPSWNETWNANNININPLGLKQTIRFMISLGGFQVPICASALNEQLYNSTALVSPDQSHRQARPSRAFPAYSPCPVWRPRPWSSAQTSQRAASTALRTTAMRQGDHVWWLIDYSPISTTIMWIHVYIISYIIYIYCILCIYEHLKENMTPIMSMCLIARGCLIW